MATVELCSVQPWSNALSRSAVTGLRSGAERHDAKTWPSLPGSADQSLQVILSIKLIKNTYLKFSGDRPSKRMSCSFPIDSFFPGSIRVQGFTSQLFLHLLSMLRRNPYQFDPPPKNGLTVMHSSTAQWVCNLISWASGILRMNIKDPRVNFIQKNKCIAKLGFLFCGKFSYQ